MRQGKFKGTLAVIHGFLGHVDFTKHGRGAKAIVAAHKAVIRNFCSVGPGRPLRCPRAARGLLPGKLDEPLENNLREAVSFLNADAASVEVAALDELAAEYPNCLATLKDCTHAGRRLLKRPQDAIPDLTAAYDMISGKVDSPLQQFQNSDQIRSIWDDQIKKKNLWSLGKKRTVVQKALGHQQLALIRLSTRSLM